MTHAERAGELHNRGDLTCSQAVAMAFADVVDMSEEDLYKVTEAFGSGGATLEGTCGAIAGALVIVGLLKSSGKPGEDTRKSTYRLAKAVMNAFRAKNGAVICKEIKGVETGKVLRSCHGCVLDAAQILDICLEMDKEGKI